MSIGKVYESCNSTMTEMYSEDMITFITACGSNDSIVSASSLRFLVYFFVNMIY